MSYRVKHIFRTVQGEGHWMGRPAVFVRFVGCNVWSGYEADRERDAARSGAQCPLWCDTDFTKEGSATYTASALVQAMRDEGGPIDFCVLTGGEPLLQADAPLMEALHDAGYVVAVETNGTQSIADHFTTEDGTTHPPDWVVCSPKHSEDDLVLEWFDELKVVVPDYPPADYQQFATRARAHTLAGRRAPLLWVQPEDGPRLDKAQEQAVAWALEHPAWRVSTQTHKVLGVA